jgi:hypothetical protein
MWAAKIWSMDQRAGPHTRGSPEAFASSSKTILPPFFFPQPQGILNYDGKKIGILCHREFNGAGFCDSFVIYDVFVNHPYDQGHGQKLRGQPLGGLVFPVFLVSYTYLYILLFAQYLLYYRT